MIKPKPYTVQDMDGNDIEIILSRFPATIGREISVKYPMSNLPKIGDYQVSDDTMKLLMKHVFIPSSTEGADPIGLKTIELINSHLPDAETLIKTEMAMLEYNFTFFRKGRISDFLGEFVQMITARIIEISTQSSAPSSAPAAPLSTNSAPSTT